MNRALRIIVLSNAIFCFAGALFGPLYAIYVERITGNIIHIGASVALFSATTASLTFAFSKFSDRLKETEFLLILGFIFRAVGWIFYIFINAAWQIYAIQIILAFGEAFGSPAFNALFAVHLDQGKYLNEYGTWISIALLTSGIASFLGAIIVSLFGFKPLFVFMASFALMSALIVYLQPRRLL